MNDNDSADIQLFQCQLLGTLSIMIAYKGTESSEVTFREGIALKSDFKIITSQRINRHFSVETSHHFL